MRKKTRREFIKKRNAGCSIIGCVDRYYETTEGVYFENAYTYCPVCVPVRAVILTGRSIESLGVRRNGDYDSPAVADVPTFDNILSGLGYYTEYYGKWHTPYKFASTYDNYVRQVDRRRETGKA